MNNGVKLCLDSIKDIVASGKEIRVDMNDEFNNLGNSVSQNQNVSVNTQNSKTMGENKKLNNRLKLIFVLVIAVIIIFFVIKPYLTFKNNEKDFQKAAENYFDSNTSELPTGERVAEVTLQKLYEKGYIDSDYYIPYRVLTKKTCSVTESWVRVRKEDDEYKYYTYLKCGLFSSGTDHKGPKITLDGAEKLNVSLGETFKDPGVKSVVDSKDGTLDPKDVTVKGKVNTQKIGTYKLTYTAFDKLKNKSSVTRTVKVVQRLKNTVNKETNKVGYYIGREPNNYIYFSGMLFRIIGVEGDNVKIVADKDIANVNYDGIDEWLKYFYSNINKESKKLIVKTKYCSMTLKEKDTNATSCSDYTEELNSYIPSVVDINLTGTNGDTFLKPKTMSWVADKESNKKGYVTRDIFYNEYFGKSFVAYENKLNFGVRPVVTIKGSTLISSGDGTKDDPYSLGEFSIGKADDKVNTRQSGEYIKIAGKLWRIVRKESDGATKVILNTSLYENHKYLQVNYESSEKNYTYTTKSKQSIGYKINNLSSEYIDTKLFVNHEIEVPIYKSDAKYGKETKVEKYKAKIAAPNMYEMWSAASDDSTLRSYWLINSSKDSSIKYGVSDIGVVMYGTLTPYITFGVRPVAFLHKDCAIVSGSGTETDPYIINK